jgi:hypothetical protein
VLGSERAKVKFMYIYDPKFSGTPSLLKEQPTTSEPAQRNSYYLDRGKGGFLGRAGSSGSYVWANEGLGQLPTPEITKDLSKKLKFLSLLPHYVEVNGRDVRVRPSLVDPSVMNPGIYDGREHYKINEKLQNCLKNVMVMQSNKFRNIKVALVDLTKGFAQPELAASFDHRLQLYVASVAKIAPMLGAFQLRHDLRAVLKKHHKSARDINDLFNLVSKDWVDTQHNPGGNVTPLMDGVSLSGSLVLVRGKLISISEPKSPRLDQVFADVPAGNPVTINFRSTGEDKARLTAIIDEFNRGAPGAKSKIDSLGFLERMKIMVGGLIPASNYATSTIFRDVGSLFIASTLLDSGLYDTNRKGGLWFGGGDLNSIAPPWSATAGSLAAFMTLLAQKRLVSPLASEDMQALMMKETNLSHPVTESWFKNGLKRLPNAGSLQTVHSKIGIGGGYHDCAFIQRTVDNGRKPLKYVAIGLRATSTRQLEDLILDLDKCILANNNLTPAQGGHP